MTYNLNIPTSWIIAPIVFAVALPISFVFGMQQISYQGARTVEAQLQARREIEAGQLQRLRRAPVEGQK